MTVAGMEAITGMVGITTTVTGDIGSIARMIVTGTEDITGIEVRTTTGRISTAKMIKSF